MREFCCDQIALILEIKSVLPVISETIPNVVDRSQGVAPLKRVLGGLLKQDCIASRLFKWLSKSPGQTADSHDAQ